MVAKRDYYELLGVLKGADEKQIKKAYRKKARENHPDLNPNNKQAESLFKEINEVLSDPQKRQKYDSYGHSEPPPAYSAASGGYNGAYGGFDGFGSDVDMSAIFEQFFGGNVKGDQFIRVKIEIPKNLNEKHKQALRDFTASTGTNHFPQTKRFNDKVKAL